LYWIKFSVILVKGKIISYRVLSLSWILNAHARLPIVIPYLRKQTSFLQKIKTKYTNISFTSRRFHKIKCSIDVTLFNFKIIISVNKKIIIYWVCVKEFWFSNNSRYYLGKLITIVISKYIKCARTPFWTFTPLPSL